MMINGIAIVNDLYRLRRSPVIIDAARLMIEMAATCIRI